MLKSSGKLGREFAGRGRAYTHARADGGKPTFKVQRGDIAIRTDLGGRVTPANSQPVRF